MLDDIKGFLTKPPLYAPSTNRFWDDEHISKAILQAHLNPDGDAASRKPQFIERSASWITSIAPPRQYPTLLDLGCGPGLYAQRFDQVGYKVTGVDFSRRSIDYAKTQAVSNGREISYHYQDYLTIEYDNCFDLITMIYCDFGVLSTQDRKTLLKKAYTALKSGGKLILDAFTPTQHQGKTEQKTWQYSKDGGFWDQEPHLCIEAFYRYDEDNTVLNQTIVMKDASVQCYNIWEHCFTQESLLSEVKDAGFYCAALYGDIAGKPYIEGGNMICVVLTK